MKKKLLVLLAGLMIVSGAVVGCSNEPAEEEPIVKSVTVGSKIDTEGGLLGQMIVLLLRDNGFEVTDKTGTGTTSVVRSAIISGEIDIYPDYTGNGAFFFDETASSVWNDAQQGYLRVKELDNAANGIEWLTPAPANNTWAIAVTQVLADANSLATLEDLADYINGGGNFKIAGSAEFFDSEVAMPAFEAAYGFTLTSGQLIIVGSGDTAQTEQAAAQGTDGVNAAMAYGTDGSLDAFNLIVLEDTLGVQPIYAPAPLVRAEVLTQYPEIAQILNPVFASLDLVTLQTLNGKIVVDGQSAAVVARDYLQSKGFID
ncbi:MAG: ABC transporter substrate-binding protein [Dehalogenimonas sp.]|uniref:ABC transporter substrate-binding protein n=1 Tax=Candidatus Dehalogenimonas loeffleri TaxID=3127115 RepID=A0ABZ2J3J0_9CHLR|nr:ABC transporter substrate-binding protein [Dehalogenimonas sp.]